MIRIEKRESRKTSWEKPLWADNLLEHLGLGATSISSTGSWQCSAAGWATKSSRATSHPSLQVPIGSVGIYPPLHAWRWSRSTGKLGCEHKVGSKPASGLICCTPMYKAQADIKRRQRKEWRKYGLLGQTGWENKGCWVRLWREKKKNERQEKE